MVHIFVKEFKKEENSIYTFKSAEEQLAVIKAQYETETVVKVYKNGEYSMTIGGFVNELQDGDIVTGFGIETMFNHPGAAYIAFNEMVKSNKNIQVDIWGLGEIGHFNTQTAKEDKNFQRLMRLIKLDIKRVEILKTELEKEGLKFSEVNYVFFNDNSLPKTKEHIAKCYKVLEDVRIYGMENIAKKSDNMNKIVNMLFGLI